jgi:hypothetical protein
MQARVLSRHLSGESNREIARTEGIGRDTVGRILSQQEVVESIARYQSQLLDLVPQAIGVYAEALASKDLHLAAATATKILEGLCVLQKGAVEAMIQAAHQSSPEPNHEQQRLLFLGRIVEGTIEKSRMYDMPLPPGLEKTIRSEPENAGAIQPTASRRNGVKMA